jgi:hypothetical protein
LLDFPIYDVTNRSHKQMLMVQPIANVFHGASHVGGLIADGTITDVLKQYDQRPTQQA